MLSEAFRSHARMMQSRNMPTAEEIAYQLGVPGRTLRAWLRPRYPNHIHGDPWIFTD